MKIAVHKFGGAVISEKIGFLNMCKFLNESEGKNLVVISALAFTSSKLKQCLLQAENSELAKAQKILNEIFYQHYELAKSILNEVKFNLFIQNIEEIYIKTQKIIKSISITQELTAKVFDRFIAFGEDLALELIKSYFDDKSNTKILDARNFIKTDSNFTDANPNYEIIESIINNDLSKKFDNYKNIIIQGFVGEDSNGHTTTMGFESSNLTATIFAKYLNINELTIWTNVDGIYDSDPFINKKAKLINHLSYENAYNAALAGLKLIYPEMIRIAESKNIKLTFRNGIELNNNLTIINSNEDNNPTLLIIKKLEINKNTEINNKNIYIIINELEEYYNFSKLNYSINSFTHLNLIVINPNKEYILSIILKDFSKEVIGGEIIIYSGLSKNYLSIITKKDFEYIALLKSILKQ